MADRREQTFLERDFGKNIRLIIKAYHALLLLCTQTVLLCCINLVCAVVCDTTFEKLITQSLFLITDDNRVGDQAVSIPCCSFFNGGWHPSLLVHYRLLCSGVWISLAVSNALVSRSQTFGLTAEVLEYMAAFIGHMLFE